MTRAKEEPKVGLREMTRASVRDQVAERALQLFDENGFVVGNFRRNDQKIS